MEKIKTKPTIRIERITKMDEELEATKTPEPIKLPSLRNLDKETIQILIEDKIATGG